MKVSIKTVVMVELDGASDEFMTRLYEFQSRERVFPLFTPYSGQGKMLSYYSQEDAERLREWLVIQAEAVDLARFRAR